MDAYEFIDTIQNAKKTFVKTFVQNETIARAMNDFVDAQSAYTKDAVKVGITTTATIAKEVGNATEQLAAGAHYKKMQENISSDLYTSFWKNAFQYYTPPTK